MLGALAIIAMLQGLNTPGGAIECVFPPSKPGSESVRVWLEPAPSLKDQPGLYRVLMTFGENITLKASAQPIASTDERDMLIQARGARQTIITLGLRDDGAAALNMRSEGSAENQPKTRIGACSGASPLIDRWLSS